MLDEFTYLDNPVSDNPLVITAKLFDECCQLGALLATDDSL